MMVRLLVDYRGYLTGEQFYPVGEEVDIEDLAAQELCRHGWAAAVVDDSSPAAQDEAALLSETAQETPDQVVPVPDTPRKKGRR